MTQPGLSSFRLLAEALAVACEEAALHAVQAEGLREVSALDVFLTRGTRAHAGFPLRCGRLPVAFHGEVCLIHPEQWALYEAEYREIQGAA